MKKLFILALLLISVSAYAVDFDGMTYWQKPQTPTTISWDGNGDGYEVYVWQMENGLRYLSGRMTTEKKLVVNWATRGHYIVYVRQYNDIKGVRTWTPWIRSIDSESATVGGVPHPWIVYVAPF
jgi:hypothetical protein